ncbi:hypothetical protein BC829DRAFT_207134 [Chytridium lagenaria]|nr:hypothetical protein BC829DRAFT_207134 [Chytridium lagenaria]
MDRWSTFCTVCTIPVTEHYTRADSGIKNTTDSLDAFWGRARALIRPGKWSSVGIVGPCGDFVEKVSDEMLWDSMPEDAEGLMQEFDFNVDSDNDDDENEAFPFHTFCAKLLDQEMKRRQLDLKDLFNFLEDRSPSQTLSCIPKRWKLVGVFHLITNR